MKGILVTTILALFIFKAGNSQDTAIANIKPVINKKLTLGISIGVGIPMSAYGRKLSNTTTAARKDSTHIEDGYAETGIHLDITAAYLLAENIGVMVFIGENMNPINDSIFASVNGFKQPYTLTFAKYYVGTYLAGPYFSLPANDKLKIDLRLLIGIVTDNYPTETITQPYFGSTETEVGSAKGNFGFGYSLSAGIKYDISKVMGLTFDLAYTGSSITYSAYKVVYSGPYSYTYNNNTLRPTMSLGLFTATVGAAFSF